MSKEGDKQIWPACVTVFKVPFGKMILTGVGKG